MYIYTPNNALSYHLFVNYTYFIIIIIIVILIDLLLWYEIYNIILY